MIKQSRHLTSLIDIPFFFRIVSINLFLLFCLLSANYFLCPSFPPRHRCSYYLCFSLFFPLHVAISSYLNYFAISLFPSLSLSLSLSLFLSLFPSLFPSLSVSLSLLISLSLSLSLSRFSFSPLALIINVSLIRSYSLPHHFVRSIIKNPGDKGIFDFIFYSMLTTNVHVNSELYFLLLWKFLARYCFVYSKLLKSIGVVTGPVIKIHRNSSNFSEFQLSSWEL